MTDDGRKQERKHDADKPSEGQYGGLKGGLGYGAGRDPKDAARPAEDLDLEADREKRGR